MHGVRYALPLRRTLTEGKPKVTDVLGFDYWLIARGRGHAVVHQYHQH